MMVTLLSPALSMSTSDSTPFSQYRSLRPSPTPSSSSSSSGGSLNHADEENLTITASRSLLARNKGKRKSHEDIRLLAISTHITELSYSISDIQTRIFEIQELRHKSQSSGDAAATTIVIDKALMTLDERLEAVAHGMKSVSESVIPFQNQSNGTTPDSEQVVLVRKHAVLVTEWEAVQSDTDVLREELKEDKWLTVFRTVTEQADGMMGSLEKAVNRCQDFIWQVHRGGAEDSLSQSSYRGSVSSDKNPLGIEVFNELLSSFEAKKKHYVPATSKVLAIIDNGVQNRVTKNGETLRRHGESAKRWRILKERMAKTEKEMEVVRKILTGGDVVPSESGSITSGYTANGLLATPANRSSKGRAPSRATSSTSTLSRSISPLRKFARKIAGHVRSPPVPVTPLPVSRELSSVSRDSSQSQGPSSEPAKALRRQRTSIFAFNRSTSGAPLTPEKEHKYSRSLTPESSSAPKRLDRIDDPNSTVKLKTSKQPWNSSTKVEAPDPAATIKPTPPKRPNAKSVLIPECAPLVPSTPSRRSLSRSSNASSRPWSPVTSSASTNPSIPPLPPLHPPSRAQTPSLGATPRPRPKTPSQIPAPAVHWRPVSVRQSDADDDEELTTLMQRAFSPPHANTSPSTFCSYTSSGVRIPPPRPPSRSQIPLPSVHVSSESRPSSTMSFYRPQSPLTPGSLLRAQTPESQLKAKAQQVPFYGGAGSSGMRASARQTVAGKLPPSSFRDSSTTRTPNSRPGSRSGSYTPMERDPIHLYIPASDKDPLDVEVAAIVNAIPHGLLIERVDPSLKAPPKEGEEIRASYAFSNSLSRKVVTCKLTTLTRSGARGGGMSKKVMCRVGGGWQDLQFYMLNRQSGM
ncbi:uncharacterized protein F5891DRAFT_219537 [Suillus fuscotomentosus]|uniref:GAR domain-containing protein n=1 Tax=Suillus fuscotomentosus TaxID=1912939 RepID=A0AAD4HRY9_9AGAM|nr:uncharacterized protein F5891DRAFT_219537 [Suillus fuscotomentosus]KAG1907905.1 hypothetical protein F5891DRAFT_219537 [Suillus fuscotomentosus]